MAHNRTKTAYGVTPNRVNFPTPTSKKETRMHAALSEYAKRHTIGVLDVAITAAEAQGGAARGADELCACEAGQGQGVGVRHAECVHHGPHRSLDVGNELERETGEGAGVFVMGLAHTLSASARYEIRYRPGYATLLFRTPVGIPVLLGGRQDVGAVLTTKRTSEVRERRARVGKGKAVQALPGLTQKSRKVKEGLCSLFTSTDKTHILVRARKRFGDIYTLILRE